MKGGGADLVLCTLAVMEKIVQVVFGGRLMIVEGVKWNTTAEDVIKSVLKDGIGKQLPLKSYLLLEDWRGCVRPVKYEDKVIKVFDEWGLALKGEDIPVRLRVVRRAEFLGCSKHQTLSFSDKKYRGGRVASRKRSIPQQLKSKTKYVNEVGKLNQSLNFLQGRISKLTTLIKPKKLELSLPIDVTTLPPEVEDECIALQEEYEEERKENADLLRRKEELSNNILSQKTEIETLTEAISSLEAQVLNEQHKLNRVIETSGPPELAEAQKEVNKLQSELKVRTKLNQLQSAKLRELTTAVENTEQEISECITKLHREKINSQK